MDLLPLASTSSPVTTSVVAMPHFLRLAVRSTAAF
jgi:hypothetical protein